jgi:hypothetical protein
MISSSRVQSGNHKIGLSFEAEESITDIYEDDIRLLYHPNNIHKFE